MNTLNYKTLRRGLGKGKGSGYHNIVPKDPLVHSMSSHGISQYDWVKPPKHEQVKYYKGLFQNVGERKYSHQKLHKHIKALDNTKTEIYNLLYNVKTYKGEQARYPEILDIVVLADKSHHLDFLQAHTDWEAVGYWKDEMHQQNFDQEKNTVIRIQYLDTKSGTIGKRLKKLFGRLNEYEVGENALYLDMVKLDDTSLNLRKYRTLVLNAIATRKRG